MIEYLKYLKCRCCGNEFDRSEVKENGYRCPVCEQEALQTVIDTSMVYTPDGDLGADWFENVSYHIT